jgi:hypothetical protein
VSWVTVHRVLKRHGFMVRPSRNPSRSSDSSAVMWTPSGKRTSTSFGSPA